MSLVIDSSVAIAWAAPDEINDVADSSMAIAEAVGAFVPAIWFLEVANILVMNERKGRLRSEEVSGILEDLAGLPLTVDSEMVSQAFSRTTEIARKHRLTAYDACYLELAIRLHLPLATLDRELIAAAKAEGVGLIDAGHA